MNFQSQARFRKGRGTRDQIANILWIIKKAREFQKNIYFCFIDLPKAPPPPHPNLIVAQRSNCQYPLVIEKARELQKNIYFCFIDYIKAFVWITTNGKILKEMGILDHVTSLLRNLYAGQSNS